MGMSDAKSEIDKSVFIALNLNSKQQQLELLGLS